MSVVIPTFNRADFIREAVDSVLSQDFASLEVIVVDDGSTDATPTVMAAIDDQRLHYVGQANHGRSHARNAALRLARGRYIAFLDSDDLYLPGKLRRQVAFLDENPDFAMVYTAADCVDEFGASLGQTYEATHAGDLYPEVAFFRPLTITLPTVMVRRSVLDVVGGFDECMHRFEDTDLWRRIAKRYPIGALPEPTCLIRSHEGNLLAGQDPADILAALDYYIDKVEREDADIDPLIRRAGARRLCQYYGLGMLTLASHAPFAEHCFARGRRWFCRAGRRAC